MLRIKNLTNSPYPILLADGSKEILPARGVMNVDVHPQQLPFYRSIGYFQISEVGDQVEVAREVSRVADKGGDIGGDVGTDIPKPVTAKRGRPRKAK